MAGEVEKKNIIFFYHKNHNDKFNGTSVYDKALLEILEDDFNIVAIEPANRELRNARINGMNAHYFIDLVKNVYLRQLRWLLNILRGKHLTSSENTILLVEDVYAGPVPYIVSKLKGYKLIFRAADFGEEYSRSLFSNRPIERFMYGMFRRLAEGLLIKRASLVISPSPAVESAIKTKYPSLNCKFVLLPYTRKNAQNKSTSPVIGVADDKPAQRKPVVLFLGDCRYPPNFDAAKYILNELVPKLNGFNNSFTLLIAGANSDQLFTSNYPNVEVLGPVENAEDLFLRAHIGIAPIRTAGGLSMKIVDYLTHGLRVVATPEAANGIVPNEQTTLSDISLFEKTVRDEIVREMNNGHVSHVICDEVEKSYMTDKWSMELRKEISKINP